MVRLLDAMFSRFICSPSGPVGAVLPRFWQIVGLFLVCVCSRREPWQIWYWSHVAGWKDKAAIMTIKTVPRLKQEGNTCPVAGNFSWRHHAQPMHSPPGSSYAMAAAFSASSSPQASDSHSVSGIYSLIRLSNDLGNISKEAIEEVGKPTNRTSSANGGTSNLAGTYIIFFIYMYVLLHIDVGKQKTGAR